MPRCVLAATPRAATAGPDWPDILLQLTCPPFAVMFTARVTLLFPVIPGDGKVCSVKRLRNNKVSAPRLVWLPLAS